MECDGYLLIYLLARVSLFVYPKESAWQGNRRRAGGRLGNRGNRQAQEECGLCLKKSLPAGLGGRGDLDNLVLARGLEATGWGLHGRGDRMPEGKCLRGHFV